MANALLKYDKQFDEWIMTYPKKWYDSRDLFYDALELKDIDEKESIKIFKKLLKQLPLSDLDSYTHYGYLLKKKNRIFEGKSLISRALVLAKCAIPEEYYNNPGKIIWANIDNRPFLRALHFSAIDYEEDGFYRQAEKLYDFILAANPNDNQGIRYLLPSIYVKQEKFEKLYKYCETNDDYGVAGSFGLIIADYKTNKIDSAKERVMKFQKTHPLIIQEILKKKHIEPKSFYYKMGFVSSGSYEEAYNYYRHMSEYFKRNPEFIKFLLNCK